MIGLTGFPGWKPLLFYSATGIQGYGTGKGTSFIKADLWENPRKEVRLDGTIVYKVDQYRHCAFGPAWVTKTETKWFIRNQELSDDGIKMIQAILADIKLAPLYINDPVLRYTANWMLKNSSIPT